MLAFHMICIRERHGGATIAPISPLTPHDKSGYEELKEILSFHS